MKNNSEHLNLKSPTIKNVKRGKPNNEIEAVVYYKFAKLNINLNNVELHNIQTFKIASWIEQIVKIESPVHFDEVARRIVDAASISKIGSRIREAIMVAVKYSITNNKILVKNDFLYHEEQIKICVRNREEFTAGSKKIKYIPEEEIINSLQKIVHDSFTISIDESISLLATSFGFQRVTEDIKNEIESLIKKAIKQKIVSNIGGMLKGNN